MVSQPHAPIAPCPSHDPRPVPAQWVSQMYRAVRTLGDEPICHGIQPPRWRWNGEEAYEGLKEVERDSPRGPNDTGEKRRIGLKGYR